MRSIHLALEEARGAGAVALGAIEGQIGVLEQLVGIVAVARADGNADRGADDDLVVIEVEGGAKRRLAPS